MKSQIAEESLRINLSEVLDRAEKGEEITIARANGRALRLTAADAPQTWDDAHCQDILAEMRSIRERHPLDGITIRELIEEGRRY